MEDSDVEARNPVSGPSSARVRLNHSEIVETLQRIARACEMSELDAQLRLLSTQAEAGFSIGVIGEQPAKARLFNAVVGVEILDPYEGLGQKRYVEQGEVDCLRSGGIRRFVGPGKESWADARRILELMPVLHFEISSERLRTLHATLCDIPPDAAGLLTQEEWRSIEECHGLVLLIEASSLLTRHEVELLYQINYRTGPCLLAILVVGLEHIEKSERDVVIKSIKTVARRRLGGARVIPAPPGEAGDAEFVDLVGDLRSSLSAVGPEWAFSARLAVLAHAALERLDALVTADSDRGESVRSDITTDADYLLDVKLESRARTTALVATVERDVADAGRNLTFRLRSQLDQLPDVMTWLRDNLVDQVSEALAATASSERQRITTVMTDKISWIEHLGAEYGIGLAQLRIGVPEDLALPPVAFQPIAGDSSERIRLLTRLTADSLAAATSVLSRSFQVPIPNPGAMIKTVLEEIERRKNASDLPKAKTIVSRFVRRSFDDLSQEIVGLIRRFDTALLDELSERQQQHDEPSTPNHRVPVETLAAWQAEIQSALISLRG